MIHRKKIKKYRNRNFKRRSHWKRKSIVLAIAATAVFLLANTTLSAIISARTNKAEKNNTSSGENTTINKEIPTPPRDTDIIKGSNVTYEGQKHAISADKVESFLNGQANDDKKYVFLTFDDGPSNNTEKVLNTLKEKGVKATFFVLGQNIKGNSNSAQILKRAVTEGNAIANHSYTHDLKKLYPNNSINIDYFMKEFNDTNNLLKDILGKDFDTRVLRMPGGYNSRKYYNDPSLPAFDSTLNENKIVSLDWNALNGDAEGKNYSTNDMLSYAKKSSNGQNKVVILMHDTYGKEKTAEMLPALIDYYKSQGYEFKTIQS